eukprot:9501576-Pyramimonas_sp.AAC.1
MKEDLAFAENSGGGSRKGLRPCSMDGAPAQASRSVVGAPILPDASATGGGAQPLCPGGAGQRSRPQT